MALMKISRNVILLQTLHVFLHFKLQQSINQSNFRWLLFPSMSQIVVLKHRSMKCLRHVTEQKQNARITLNAPISTRMP